MLYQQSVAILNVVRIAQIIRLTKLTLKVSEKNILKTLKTLSEMVDALPKSSKNLMMKATLLKLHTIIRGIV